MIEVKDIKIIEVDLAYKLADDVNWIGAQQTSHDNSV